MSDLFIYDINQYLQADSQMQTLMENNNFIITPGVAYDETAAPFIMWTYYVDIKSPELPWWRIDKICYDIFDDDADRCLRIGERIISLLSITDKIQNIPSYHLGLWCFLEKGNFIGPQEREGWYSYRLDFEVSHLPD